MLYDTALLRTFTAVCDSVSFTKAANEVNLTQSAVSLHVKRLEEQVGNRSSSLQTSRRRWRSIRHSAVGGSLRSRNSTGPAAPGSSSFRAPAPPASSPRSMFSLCGRLNSGRMVMASPAAARSRGGAAEASRFRVRAAEEPQSFRRSRPSWRDDRQFLRAVLSKSLKKFEGDLIFKGH
jgi:hypothetical protein